MKKLKDILNITNIQITGNSEIEINEIIFDSRKVIANCMFVAISGTQVDGHKYIAKAIDMGATCIVCEILPAEINPDITYIKVADSSETLAIMASNFYDNPSRKLKLIGVTGTNGKTTIATLLYNLTLKLGYKAGLLSTVENFINNTVIKATHTTPDAIQINKLLNQMVEADCDYCFMEVSSHAIKQNRIKGLQFVGGIFTNITHDHLDYHKTFDDYLKTKKQFFDNLPKTAFAITNVDDKNGNVMLQNTKATKKTYGVKSFADFKCKVLESDFTGMLLNVDNIEVWTKFIGSFNASNLMAVYSTALMLEHDKIEILAIISELSSVNGRFETIKSDDEITAIVDYAHTPNALKNVISTINDIRKGDNSALITVVGAGGDRDKTKRPIMAQIASEQSDKVILTSDNPRTEKPETIIAEMQKGVDIENKRKVISILNREEAIKTACMLAQKGDIILVAGKGHETYQEINGVRHHFDDKEILREIFKQ